MVTISASFGEDADFASRIYLLSSFMITSQPVSRVCVSRTTLVASFQLATRSALFGRLRRQRSNMPVTKHQVPLHANSVRSAPEVLLWRMDSSVALLPSLKVQTPYPRCRVSPPALRKRSRVYKPPFAFVVVDKAIEDVVLLIHFPMT